MRALQISQWLGDVGLISSALWPAFWAQVDIAVILPGNGSANSIYVREVAILTFYC